MAPLDTFFNDFEAYRDAYASYRSRGIVRTLNPADREYQDDGDWALQHYFEVGEDALRLVIGALISTGRPQPGRILDFPSGSGRVTRHLRAFWPNAEIWAADINHDHLRFCGDRLGVRTMRSVADLTTLKFECKFDVIFCGSLLTHLPESDTQAALRLIGESLSETGIAVVTLHGRHSHHVHWHQWKYIDDDSFRLAERAVDRNGFGFVNYPAAERARLGSVGRYGVSLVNPSWVMTQLERDPAVRIFGYAERAWDNHQDVVTFGRSHVSQ